MTSIAEYNNNPGNLRPPPKVKYEGQIGVDERGFAIFENAEAGRNALIQDILIKQRRGLNTPESFIDRYAPAGAENPDEDRENYKMRLAQHLGLKSTSDPFPKGSEQKIADLIASFESGQPIGQKQDKKGYEAIFGVGTLTESQRMAEEPEPPEYKAPEGMSKEDAALYGGVVGLVAGQVAKGTKVPTSAKYNAAVERLNDARDRLTVAQKSGVGGQTLAGLENELRMRQGVATQAADELKLAEAELKAARSAATAPITAAPEAAPGRASGPKVAGASASSNYARALAGQQHQLPEALLAQVEDYTKSSPKGAHTLIRQDLEKLRRIQQIGGGGFELSGDVMVPPNEAARRAAAMEAELAQRQAADAAERARLAQEAQAKAAAADQRVQAAKQARRAAGTAVDEQSQAVKKAREDAKSVAKAQSAVNVAEARVARTPSGPEGIFGKTGAATAKAAPRVLGVVSGAATWLTATEAWKEWNKAMDTFKKTGTMPPISDAVVRTLEAFFGGLSMVPPYSPPTAIMRGVGTLGGLGMLGYEVLKNADPRDARKSALAARRAPLDMPTPAPLSPREAENLVASGDPRLINIYQNDPQVARLLRLSQVTQ